MAKSTSKLFENEVPKEMAEDAMNLPDTEEKQEESTELSNNEKSLNELIMSNSSTSAEDDIVDVNISAIKRKRFRINGDNSKILELNTSDLNIASRMSAAYERLLKCMDEVGKVLADLPDDDSELSDIKEKEITKQLDTIDSEMRKELDYIFDAPVSEVCGYGGSMYDPFNGMFRFEHIIDAITKLYETNLNNEFNSMRRRVNTRTSKYTKKFHK